MPKKAESRFDTFLRVLLVGYILKFGAYAKNYMVNGVYLSLWKILMV